jgi:hypothetical protein
MSIRSTTISTTDADEVSGHLSGRLPASDASAVPTSIGAIATCRSGPVPQFSARLLPDARLKVLPVGAGLPHSG